MKKINVLLLSLTLILGLAGCGGKTVATTKTDATTKAEGTTKVDVTTKAAAKTENTTIKLGVVGENNEQWKPVIESLAKEGITLQLVKFADYTLPNQALADKEIDLNAFQHYAYLKNEVANKGLKLTPIGETLIAPLGLYSKKITNTNQLKNGDTIAIPSDATNGGRSLKVLEAAGLIKVDPKAGYTPTLKDITSNDLNLKFYEVEAANTASLLPDVAAAIINGGHAIDAGFNPQKDAIYLETVNQGSDNPYINIVVARTEDAKNEKYLKVVAAFRTEAVAKVIAEAYKGAYIPTWK